MRLVPARPWCAFRQLSLRVRRFWPPRRPRPRRMRRRRNARGPSQNGSACATPWAQTWRAAWRWCACARRRAQGWRTRRWKPRRCRPRAPAPAPNAGAKPVRSLMSRRAPQRGWPWRRGAVLIPHPNRPRAPRPQPGWPRCAPFTPIARACARPRCTTPFIRPARRVWSIMRPIMPSWPRTAWRGAAPGCRRPGAPARWRACAPWKPATTWPPCLPSPAPCRPMTRRRRRARWKARAMSPSAAPSWRMYSPRCATRPKTP